MFEMCDRVSLSLEGFIGVVVNILFHTFAKSQS